MGLRVLSEVKSITVALDATESDEFTVERWANSVGVLFETIDKCIVMLEVAEDSGGTFRPIMDIGVAQKAKTLGYIDIGKHFKGAAQDWVYRFSFSKPQATGPHTIKVSMRG